MRPPRARTRVLAVFATLALAGTALVASAGVGAQDPVDPITETSVDLTCRASSPTGVQTNNQTSTFRVEAPETVAPGETFDIVLRPLLNEIPTSASGATIRKILDLRSVFLMPEGVTVNSVVEEAPPGSDTVGYYLAPGASREDPSVRQAIPGGSSVSFNPATRYVETVLNGTGSPTSNTGEFRGGSAVQPPHIRINVTNESLGGTVLETRLGGTLPANTQSLPWADPSLVTTTRANLIIDVTTTAYCAPIGAQNPVLASVTVAGPAINVESPVEDGNYAQGDEVAVDYECESTPLFTVESCEASVDGAPVANGALLPTASLGARTFLVTAVDPDGRVSTFPVPYNVVENTVPEVSAGADQTVATSATVTLSGTATDIDGPPPQSITTEWTQLSGPSVTLADPSALETTFEAPFEGPATLVFELTATDSVGGTSSDTVTIEVLANRNPVADGGEEQTVAITQTATLDASASTDPDGHPITFSWAQTGGVPVTLDDPTSATPSFTAPIAAAATQLSFEVTVSDDRGGVDTATAIVNVAANEPPVANAGPDQNGVRSLQTVTLNGSGSADPFGLDITYEWTQVSGTPVTLSNPTAVNPNFVVPPKPDFVYPHAIVFELVVTDELGLSSVADSVSINVIATAPTVGTPVRTPTDTPCAREDVVWTAPLTNPDGYPIVWEWQLTRDQASFFAPAGTAAANSTTAGTFSNLDQADPKMRLPNASRTTANGPQVRTRAIAQLPGGGSLASAFTGNSATFAVTASTTSPCNARPVANSGPYQDVAPGSTVTLSGVGFPFGTGSIAGYTWTQTAGTPVTLSGANTATATFTAPANLGDLRFQLVATQGTTNSRPSPTKVRVVPAPPTANAGPDQTGIVVGEGVTLNGSASVGEPGVTLGYQWTQIGGPSVTLADATTTTPSFTAPGGPATLTFQLRVSGSNTTLTSVDTVSVFVNNSAPTANAGPNQVSTEGLTVTLNGSGSSDPDGQALSYSWTQVSGNPVTLSSANAAQPTFTAPAPGPLVFVLTVSDGQGGFDSDAVTITVFPAANASFTATPTRGLAPLAVSVNGSASTSPNGPVVAYQWDFGNGQTATGVNASTTYTTPGVYTITLTVTDNQGAKGTTTRIIEVPPLPVATFTATPIAADPPFTVQLDASGSTSADGNIVSYEWDFGDGRTDTGVTTSVEYDETQDNQRFTITLTVTDDNGGVDTFTREIRVGNQLPTASFTRTPAVGVNPLTVNVNGSASSDLDGTIVSYAWNFGNGQTATGATASTVYTTPGEYTITLVVTDNRGGTGTTTQTFTVGQNQPPTAVLNLNTLGAAPFNLVANGASSFDVDGTITSYQFTLTGTTSGGAPVFSSVPAGPASSQTFSLPQPGNYSITLVVTDDKGVTGSVTESVLVGQSPTASFTATPTSGLNPLVVNFNAGASSDPDGTIVNYAWNFGNGQTATGVTASTIYTNPGTFIATLTVTDNNGLTASTTRTITVAPNQAPVANIAATPTSGVNPLVVQVSGAGSTDDGTIVSYAWDFGNGQTATGVTASTTYEPGTYTITLTVTDDKGVTGTTTQSIEVGENQAPIASFTATPSSGDTPLVVAVDASASSDLDGTIVSYAWNFGNGTTATGVTANGTYPVAGNYTITLTVTDDKGVTSSTTRSVSVSVPVGARDAINVRFGGAVDYEYVGPTIGNSMRIVRDAFGPLRVRGTETFPSLVEGQGEIRATLDRFLIFNAFTGDVRVRDVSAGLNLTTSINFLSGLSQPTATSVRGQGSGFVGTLQSYSLTFVIDDRS